MKMLILGLTLLFMLSLASAGQEDSKTNSTPTTVTQQTDLATADPSASGSPSQSALRSPVMSRVEADSLRIVEGTLFTNSDVSDIRVGSVGNNDLIYILVVVLLVVLIIAVI